MPVNMPAFNTALLSVPTCYHALQIAVLYDGVALETGSRLLSADHSQS